MSIELLMPSNHLILCRLLLLLPSIFPSIRGFSNESVLRIRWLKYWNFSIVLPMNIQDWFPLGLTGLISLQSKGLALTRWTCVGKLMSLLFKILSRFVIVFLPRSKCLWISWLQSPSAVILDTQENKACHCFHCFPIYLSWCDGTGCHDLRFLNVEF